MVLSCATALVCALFIEYPMVELAKYMFKSRNHRPIVKNHSFNCNEETEEK